MKAKELLAYLKSLESVGDDLEDDVRVLVKRSSPSIGPRHSVGVKTVSSGFDWENGKLLITTDEPVYAGLGDLKAAAEFARKVREAMYWKANMDDTRQKNANALQSIERALDEWIPDRSEKESDPANPHK